MTRLLGADHRTGVTVFRASVNAGFAALTANGLQSFDLESDVDCFTVRLPRVRVILIEQFDPVAYP